MAAGRPTSAETLAAYAAACLDAGADGLFYATNVARADGLGAAECRRFQRPFDLRVLDAVARAPFNVLHVCGPAVHFDEFADYPVTAFSWALAAGNPTLAEGHRRTGRAVMGGLPAKPEIATMSGQARRASGTPRARSSARFMGLYISRNASAAQSASVPCGVCR